jgi:hypothetical protein
MKVYGVYEKILTSHLLSLHSTEESAKKRVLWLARLCAPADHVYFVQEHTLES